MRKCWNAPEHRSLLATGAFASRGVKILYVVIYGHISPFFNDIQGLADWDKIRAVKQAVSIPVFANGNILYQSDIVACLKATGADGVMSAEGQLYNPALFAGIERLQDSTTYDSEILERQPRHADLALEYLSIVRDLKSATSVSAIKGHLFKIMRPGLIRELDLREKLGRVKINQKKLKEQLSAYISICEEMKIRMEVCIFMPWKAPVLTKGLERWESCGRSTSQKFDYCWAYYGDSCDAALVGSTLFPTSIWSEESLWLVVFLSFKIVLGELRVGIVVESQSEDQAYKPKSKVSKRPLDDIPVGIEEVKKARTTLFVDALSSDSAVPVVKV